MSKKTLPEILQEASARFGNLPLYRASLDARAELSERSNATVNHLDTRPDIFVVVQQFGYDTTLNVAWFLDEQEANAVAEALGYIDHAVERVPGGWPVAKAL